MLKSRAKRLILLIGGGVANFTDIRVTFSGIIRALEQYKKEVIARNVMIIARRGGPYQKEGLRALDQWAQQNNVPRSVWGPELPLHEIVMKTVDSM